MTNLLAMPKNPNLKFTMQHVDYLKGISISANAPGTLLQDFNTLLNFIGSAGTEVSINTHFIPMKSLLAINQRMSRPIQPKTARPTQKTFPHINGLYLLLRASGLGLIQTDKKKVSLVLDSTLLSQWQQLNDVEKYFALFQAWAKRNNDEIVYERSHLDASCFEECYYFLENGIRESIFAKNVDSLRYRLGLHRLALLEFFGLVNVELNTLDEKNHWPIACVQPTKFGQALVSCIANIDDFNYHSDQQISSWIEVLRNYFPAWQNELLPEQTTAENKIVTFKVILEQSYRRIAVSSELNLDQLADHILSVFSFDHDHLYEFKYKNRYGITQRIAHPYLQDHDGETTDESTVSELPLQVGALIIFHFDFGDDWMFNILVEGVEDKLSSQANFKLLEKVGKVPKQYIYDDL